MSRREKANSRHSRGLTLHVARHTPSFSFACALPTIIVCSSHLQGAILTTMLATRNFSSKYDAQGKYLRPSSALYMDHDRQYSYISR